MTNEILCCTKFLQLRSYTRANGGKWVYAHRPNAKDVAVIVPVVKIKGQEHILFLITKRPPIFSESKGVYCLEMPAGLVGDTDKDEDIECALARELKEESGYRAEDIQIVTKTLASSAGALSETSTVAIAYINGDKEHALPEDNDGGVIIERKLIKKGEILKFIKDFESKGNAIGAQTLSGLFFYFFDK